MRIRPRAGTPRGGGGGGGSGVAGMSAGAPGTSGGSPSVQHPARAATLPAPRTSAADADCLGRAGTRDALLSPASDPGRAAVPCLGVRPRPSAGACRARAACRGRRCATRARDPHSHMATWEMAIKPYKSPVKKGTTPMRGQTREGPGQWRAMSAGRLFSTCPCFFNAVDLFTYPVNAPCPA